MIPIKPSRFKKKKEERKEKSFKKKLSFNTENIWVTLGVAIKYFV